MQLKPVSHSFTSISCTFFFQGFMQGKAAGFCRLKAAGICEAFPSSIIG
jgi:hypothetical protein